MSTTASGRYCTIHGTYFGFMCPMCNSSVPSPSPVPQVPFDPTLARIAAALERIADEMALSRHHFHAKDTP